MSQESGPQSSGPLVYIVFTVGLPGLGKSSLINRLKTVGPDLGVAMETCVSDEVRSHILAQEYLARQVLPAQLSQEDLFQIELESGPKIKAELNRQIGVKLESLRRSGAPRCVFILDKNHCPAALVAFVKSSAEAAFPTARIEKRVLLPSLEREPQADFGPFTFDTVAVALVRSLGRKGHLTMNHGSLHSLLSFVTCLQNHVADDFDSKFPPGEYKRVPAEYYLQAQAAAAKELHKDHYDRLRLLLLGLAKREGSLSATADAICASAGQLGSMSVFPPLDDLQAAQFFQKVLQ